MDGSLQGIRSRSDNIDDSFTMDEDVSVEEVEAHIHLPNPSLWPFILSIALAVTLGGLLFVNTFPWISLLATIFVLIGILGFAVEDPMAHRAEEYISIQQPVEIASKYKIGQNVIDTDGKYLGKVQARFSRYILVERGSFVPKVYYVPQSTIKEAGKQNTIALTLSEEDLQRMELNRVPDDLYEESPEYGVPDVSGVAQFAQGPLSPAQTGHYNYGRRWPGINTDASGSYHRNEVLPKPQQYVREKIYSTDKTIPSSAISPD